MNTRLSIAAALLSITALPAAQAQSQVTIYGITAVELVHVTGVAPVAGASATGTQTRLDNSQVTTSRLGFKGVEDLGGGLGAVFGLESGIGLDTGSAGSSNGTLWNRGSYVGLTDPVLGTLTLGRQWNTNDDIMGNYFIFGGYSAFRFREFGFISDLVNNSFKYVSQSWGGFRLRGLYGLGEGTTGSTGEVALNYSSGNLSAGASYREAKNLAGAADKLTSAGASYAIGNFKPHVGWSQSDSQASGFPKARSYDVGLTWSPNAPWVVDADYVVKDQLSSGNDAHFWRIQAQYYLSKRTSLMGNVVWLKNDGSASERFYGAGAPGVDQTVVSLGLRHSF
ncbi:MAG: porin [Proteobacteria bacterium]|nr:porin [Pseudomonadota bacterium]